MTFVDLLTRTNAVFRIVGVSFYREAVAQLHEGDSLTLVCEEGNPHDPFAIRVCNSAGATVGYVPSDVARRIRQDCDRTELQAVVDKERVFEGATVGADIRVTG